MANYGIDMDNLLAVMGALADRSRLRLVLACTSGELCVCQLVELLGLAPSTVSKHLWILRQAGLIESRKEGRWIYCRLPQRPGPAAAAVLKLLRAELAEDGQAAADVQRVKAILRMDPEKLCHNQRAASSCCPPAVKPRARRLAKSS